MKVIFKVADTREPIRTYQLEHRSGAKIKVVEDGIDITKHEGETIDKFGSSSHQAVLDDSFERNLMSNIGQKKSARMTIFFFLLLQIAIKSAIKEDS